MPLKSKLEVLQLATIKMENVGRHIFNDSLICSTSTTWNQESLVEPSYFRYTYLNYNIFNSNQYTRGPIIPFNSYFKSINRYFNKTRKDQRDIITDFTYHWITNFAEYTSYNQIKTGILDPELCGSLSLQVALNLFIKNNSLSTKEIATLLKGSVWRWHRYSETGYYAQKGLYYFPANNDYPLIIKENPDIFPTTQSLPRSFEAYLRHMKRKIDDLEHSRLERERNGPRELENYSTRATNYFPFKQSPKKAYNHFLGIELELEGFSQKEFKSLDILKEHAIFKKDGSLRQGVEICTAPATLDVHKEAFAPFFIALKTNDSSLIGAATCGLHVHIDKSKLSNLHIANIHKFINYEGNQSFIINIAGRTPNTFCKNIETQYNFFTTNKPSERYCMVNLIPEKTIELRFFASTIDPVLFNSRLDFTQAVIDYCKPGEVSVSIKELHNWDNFKKYVFNHRKIYPDLVKGIKE